MSYDEWIQIKHLIRYDFLEDNHYQEIKRNEILHGRLEALRNIQDYVGIYYSKDWVRKNVLNLTDTEIEDIQKEIEAAKVETPPAADGDANDDGFADRHNKASFGENKDKSLLNMEYIQEQSVEKTIDDFISSKLNQLI